MQEREDGELVKQVLAGDDAAYAVLVGRYRARVFSSASRYARNHAELEDLTQDIFIRIWKGLKTYRADAPFEHWLMTVTVRTCYDFLRKHRKRREREVLVEEMPSVSMAGDGMFSEDAPEERLRRQREAWEVVKMLMEKLNAKERLVITLMELEEKSVKETAQLTGWSESNVKVRAFRARKKMRAIFAAQQQEI
ncbi:MAG: RNA polymerase sigma factor [Verrucomicrobiales bacterium]|nr:RNA polymerase sigma factor [Verrucomicrobiales bacterium]